jgi:hypothetical protein
MDEVNSRKEEEEEVSQNGRADITSKIWSFWAKLIFRNQVAVAPGVQGRA